MRRQIKKGLYIGASLAMGASGPFLEDQSEKHLVRNVLPEPFDFPDHVGNFNEASIGFLVPFLLVKGVLDGRSHNNEVDAKKRRVRIAAGVSFVLSSAVQILGEKYGLGTGIDIEGKPVKNTKDMVDAFYGIGWAGVVSVASAYCVNKVIDHSSSSLPDRSYTVDSDHAAMLAE